MNAELKPVGWYCDHSDEPHDARTHHGWEWVDGEGNVFTHQPNTISSHGGTQDYLPEEKREIRCPRAVPVYAGPDVERLRSTVLEQAADHFDRTLGEWRGEDRWSQGEGDSRGPGLVHTVAELRRMADTPAGA